ncbi:MAG: hypothetical protein L6408_08495, partial [Nanoarchaeota archaeon]|nr:hypothetical protein [Nanoarchaeota archaeon]
MFSKSKKEGRKNVSKIAKFILYSSTLAIFALQGIGCTTQSYNLKKDNTQFNVAQEAQTEDQSLEAVVEKEHFSKTDEEFFRNYPELMKDLTSEILYTSQLYTRRPERTEEQKKIVEQNGIDVVLLDERDTLINTVEYAKDLLSKYANQKEVLRSIFLPSGYFFTENKDLAIWLYRNTNFETFFNEDVIYVFRGHELIGLRKKKVLTQLRRDWRPRSAKNQEMYCTENSESQAYLLFNDRVAINIDGLTSNKHHTNIEDLQSKLMFNTLKINGADKGLKVSLRYSNKEYVEGILKYNEDLIKFVPTSISQEEYETLLDKRKEFFDFKDKLIWAINQFQEDEVFFDEPQGERDDEQLDGLLRGLWKRAYYKGETEYTFRGVTYDVFASNGNVKTPQVCIDFVRDTFERASGNWYNPKGEKPGKTKGFLDFKKDLNLKDGYDLRRIAKLMKIAEKHKDKFEVFNTPEENRVSYEAGKAFYDNLLYLANGDMDLQSGDIFLIYGPVDYDNTMHYHSGIISNVDPLTGFPIQLIQISWNVMFDYLESTMINTETRWAHGRIRIRPEWILEQKEKFEKENGVTL